ncbi:polyamine aminopropyltransferase [Streptomyces fragilis]|uniref:polyamine aminopropyltransferase n=1 Tax=Streptomyces fragilis TaxID=67301 RepID=UPI0024DEC28E|nr:polyamine aminopropyltransferase [Streptomyces fragilis]
MIEPHAPPAPPAHRPEKRAEGRTGDDHGRGPRQGPDRAARGGGGGQGCAARLPLPPGTARFLVLAGVFVCAACGLVYELELVAMASYLMGDSVTQASVVLSVMVFAMGLGSLAAKRLRRRAAAAFGAVEAALALVGGCSAMALYAVFAWTGAWGGLWRDGPSVVLVAVCLATGLLIGVEVPLLMELIQRIRRQDPGGAVAVSYTHLDVYKRQVADLFAADYVGALVGGLAFPFLLLPRFGQLTGALLTGGGNAVVGAALVLGLFGRDLGRRARRTLLVANVLVLALLGTAAVLADDFERAAGRALYGDGLRVSLRTDGQVVALTGGGPGRPLGLYLDGRLRVDGRDERRYHEALVHPAMNGPAERVLVLGGGDGLALREVLRHRGVREVQVVDADPRLVRLARTDPGLAALNGHAYDDPRVRVGAADAFQWLRAGRGGPYDVVIADLPDPGNTASAKLYSREFYGLARRVMAPHGRLAVHAGSAAGSPRAYWTVGATLRAAGLRAAAYRVTGAAGREWGLFLASGGPAAPRLGLAPGGPRPRTLKEGSLMAAERAAGRTRVAGLPASTLAHPRY